MDIIDNFYQSKIAIDELSKKLFSLFQENDTYSIIRTSEVKYLEISEHKHSNELVYVGLYDYNDTIPKEKFEFSKSVLLACDENTVDEWIIQSKKIIIKTYTAKLRKFYKDFSSDDFKLIHAGIVNYQKLSVTMTDNDIAAYIAKYVVESNQ